MNVTLVMAAMLAAAAPVQADKAVLLVNGREVTAMQLELGKRALRAQAGESGQDAAVLFAAAVEQAIGHVLVGEAAREAGVSLTEGELDAVIDRQRQSVGGEAAFAAGLKRAGLTLDALRAYESARLLTQRFAEEVVARRVSVSDDEVAGYYRDHPDEFMHEAQLRLRMVHALVTPTTPSDAAAAAKRRVDEARRRIVAGEEFGTVAAELSDGAEKARGGEVGWVRRGMLLADLEEAVFGLGDGEVSEVLRASNGYYVFRVDGRRGAGRYPFAEVKENLREMLVQRRIVLETQKVVAARRATASILALDPAVDQALRASHASPAPR